MNEQTLFEQRLKQKADILAGRFGNRFAVKEDKLKSRFEKQQIPNAADRLKLRMQQIKPRFQLPVTTPKKLEPLPIEYIE